MFVYMLTVCVWIEVQLRMIEKRWNSGCLADWLADWFVRLLVRWLVGCDRFSD